mmetsp:Transcript_71401/g.187191  ORF Transcript_71401/g.187191 Transcript_71401/m.187191 type:complete len:188 (+) Transcript_71401:124-687(+)
MPVVPSVSGLGMSPQAYGTKGQHWDGVKTHERFDYTTPTAEAVFEEYLTNKSMSPSRHKATLATSTGLMEMHYDTMRKKALGRATTGQVVQAPTMHRAYTACAGYSGHIPGKLAGNIVGTTWQTGSHVCKESRGSDLGETHSGVVFTITARGGGGMGHSGSQGSLRPATPTSPLARTGQMFIDTGGV